MYSLSFPFNFFFLFFFFNDTATTEIYTLPYTTLFRSNSLTLSVPPAAACVGCAEGAVTYRGRPSRSEEHTSERQSHLNLVCRLLLEKKKKKKNTKNKKKKKKKKKKKQKKTKKQ